MVDFKAHFPVTIDKRLLFLVHFDVVMELFAPSLGKWLRKLGRVFGVVLRSKDVCDLLLCDVHADPVDVVKVTLEGVKVVLLLIEVMYLSLFVREVFCSLYCCLKFGHLLPVCLLDWLQVRFQHLYGAA